MTKKTSKTKDSTEKIIGRVREQVLLRDLINSKKSEFIAIYGRRRVGKTYLIKNFTSSLPRLIVHVTGLQNRKDKKYFNIENQQLKSAEYGIHNNHGGYSQCAASNPKLR